MALPLIIIFNWPPPLTQPTCLWRGQFGAGRLSRVHVARSHDFCVCPGELRESRAGEAARAGGEQFS